MKIDQLIDRIEREKVVPFVGNELCMLYNIRTGGTISIEDFLAKELAFRTNIDYNDEKLPVTADKAIDAEYDVHLILREIYNDIGESDKQVYNNLGEYETYMDYRFDTSVYTRLTEMGLKTFISISFTDILQKLLIEKYGIDKVEIINYSLTSVSDDFNSYDQILKGERVEKPVTVINLLGSIEGESEFAVTEEAYLEHFFTTISEPSESVPKNSLKNQYVAYKTKGCSFLYLGCNHPTWYTRYLVRGITKKRYQDHKKHHNFFIDEPLMDKADKSFLSQHSSNFFDTNNFEDIFKEWKISSINGRNLSEKIITGLWKIINLRSKKSPVYDGLVFISYYFKDSMLAEAINNRFQLDRIDKFFDKDSIHAGEHLDQIEDKIRLCKIFLCLISDELLSAIGVGKSDPKKMPYSVKNEWSLIESRYKAEYFFNKRDTSTISFKIFPCILDGMNNKDARIDEFFRNQRIYQLPSEMEILIEDVKRVLKKRATVLVEV